MENLYIEMCSKATQLQDKKREVGFKDGDRIYSYITNWEDYIDRVGIIFECGDDFYSNREYKETIWLPRQEDLQSLLNKSIWELNQSFHNWFLEIAKVKIDEKRSIDILWLEYIMKELYSKRWVEGEWVEQDVQNTVKAGDYVLASVYSDADLNDPWFIGTLYDIIGTENNIFRYQVEGCTRLFKFARKITKEEGEERFKQWKLINMYNPKGDSEND